MCLGIGHRVGHGTAVNIQQAGALRFGRRQCPGDRQRFVGGKRHIDKPYRRTRGVDLASVIRHIDQPTIRQAAVLQLGDFLGGRLAVRRHAQCRLKPLAGALDDCIGSALPATVCGSAPVCAPAGEHVRIAVRGCWLLRIESKDLGDAAGCTMPLAPGNCAAVTWCRI